jgi:uncharacterized protein (TIGR02246 family)
MPDVGAHEDAVRALHRRLIAAWNARSAEGFAAVFADDGECIGFDGSRMSGRAEISDSLRAIFGHHATGAYVASARGVRSLGPDVAILDAVAGIVPAGSTELEPRLNSVQTLVAARRDGEWRIALFQNTPAQYHGRPEAHEALTRELRALMP